MAVYHLSVKTISRSVGRSATAAAAYRAGVEIADERTGQVHDYTRRGGVLSAELVLPAGAPSWALDRAALWNAAETSETRKNSTVAREFEIALPAELGAEERRRLAVELAREIVERHRCAADVAVHAPVKGSDERNHHAHILCSTRRLGAEGFGEKTRELDERKTGEVERWRERFAQVQNERLAEQGLGIRVDHRRLDAQGIEREPTRHLGVAAIGYERRTGAPSFLRLQFEREAAERLAQAKEAGELERQAGRLNRSILDLSGDLQAAKDERERQRTVEQQKVEREARAFAFQATKRFKAELAAKELGRQAAERLRSEQERQKAAKPKELEKSELRIELPRQRGRDLGR
jgi:ATP-dependent exoDNAse (exonuclease V) alpha subunit